MPSIGIIGAGSWGCALAAAAARKPHNAVYLWGRDPKVLQSISDTQINTKYLPDISLPSTIKTCSSLDQLITKSDILLLAVPSHSFSDVLSTLKSLNIHKPIIWATKGLMPKTGEFLGEELSKNFPNVPMAYLGGPSFAKEVAKNLPTAVVVASNDQEFATQVQEIFHTNEFRVYSSTDLVGAQLGGVLKNIVAVAAGISDGLGFGANARAALITRGIAEMIRLGKKLNASSQTLMGLTGCGDLFLTCSDNQSRNRRLGLALANNKTIAEAQSEIGQATEALSNAIEVCLLADQHGVDMPIATQVSAVLQGNCTCAEAVENLMTRDPKPE